jgi:hypothetical protein
MRQKHAVDRRQVRGGVAWIGSSSFLMLITKYHDQLRGLM